MIPNEFCIIATPQTEIVGSRWISKATFNYSAATTHVNYTCKQLGFTKSRELALFAHVCPCSATHVYVQSSVSLVTHMSLVHPWTSSCLLARTAKDRAPSTTTCQVSNTGGRYGNTIIRQGNDFTGAACHGNTGQQYKAPTCTKRGQTIYVMVTQSPLSSIQHVYIYTVLYSIDMYITMWNQYVK